MILDFQQQLCSVMSTFECLTIDHEIGSVVIEPVMEIVIEIVIVVMEYMTVADLGGPRGKGPLSKPDNYIHLALYCCVKSTLWYILKSSDATLGSCKLSH